MQEKNVHIALSKLLSQATDNVNVTASSDRIAERVLAFTLRHSAAGAVSVGYSHYRAVGADCEEALLTLGVRMEPGTAHLDGVAHELRGVRHGAGGALHGVQWRADALRVAAHLVAVPQVQRAVAIMLRGSASLAGKSEVNGRGRLEVGNHN